MKLLMQYLIQPIFPCCWMGFLQSLIIDSVLYIPDSDLVFVGSPHFGASLKRCLGPMQLSIVMNDFGAPFFVIIYFLRNFIPSYQQCQFPSYLWPGVLPGVSNIDKFLCLQCFNNNVVSIF